MKAEDTTLRQSDIQKKFPRLNLKLPDGYLDSVLTFAQLRGLHGQFVEQLRRLNEMWVNADRDTEVLVWKDFAPYSFEFAIHDTTGDRRPIMNGGLIYHGRGEQGQETLSVRFDTDEEWQIHT